MDNLLVIAENQQHRKQSRDKEIRPLVTLFNHGSLLSLGKKEQMFLTEGFQIINVETMRKIENHFQNVIVIIVPNKIW